MIVYIILGFLLLGTLPVLLALQGAGRMILCGLAVAYFLGGGMLARHMAREPVTVCPAATLIEHGAAAPHNESVIMTLRYVCNGAAFTRKASIRGYHDDILPVLDAAIEDGTAVSIWADPAIITGLKIGDVLLKDPQKTRIYRISLPFALLAAGLLAAGLALGETLMTRLRRKSRPI